MKKMLKRLCTGFLALATVVTALPTTPVHAESKQYWTESAERVGIIEKVMLQLSVSLCQIKSRVIICSVVRCSVDAAIMQCLYEMVRGFIAVIPRWLKRFLVMVCV